MGTTRWADEMAEGVHLMKSLRDELKVQLHLLGMDARVRFQKLEQRIDDEQLTARKNIDNLIAELKHLKAELGKQGHGE